MASATENIGEHAAPQDNFDAAITLLP